MRAQRRFKYPTAYVDAVLQVGQLLFTVHRKLRFRLMTQGLLFGLTVLSVALVNPQIGHAADQQIADTFSTPINEALNLNVLANDPPGMTLVDNTPPAFGTLTSDSHGGFTYLPNANFSGADRFTYTAIDADGVQGSATVAIEVTGTPDRVEARSDIATTDEDIPILIYPLGNDASGPGGGNLVPTVETQPANGIAEPQWDGSILFTPALNWSGDDEIVYRVSDGITSDTGLIAIKVQPVGDPPDAVDDVVFANQDVPAEIDVLVNDSEQEGDAISFVENGQPGNGVATWHDSTRMITYEPLPGVHGVDQFTYSIADIDGIDIATVTININGAPIAIDDQETGFQGSEIMLDLLSNDSDPEAGPLVISNFTKPAHGKLTLDLERFAISYLADSRFTGDVSFTYTIEDDRGNQATANVLITVTAGANHAPEAIDDEFLVSEDSVGNTLDILSNDLDSESDPLTLLIDSTPMHGDVTVDALQQVVYVPKAEFAGQDVFTYSVTDGSGGSSSATVTIDVEAVNGRPVAVPDAIVTDEDTAITINLLANDTDVDSDLLAIRSVSDSTLGNTSIDGDGLITFTPDQNISGSEQLVYEVSDGSGEPVASTISLEVHPINDTPLASDDSAHTTVDTPIVISVLANDQDADGDHPLFVSIETTPAEGTAIVQFDGSVLFTPVTGFEGEAKFTYRLTDPWSAFSVATVTITIEPQADPLPINSIGPH